MTELNYSGRVDPQPGDVMGPGVDGKYWRVLGAMYDSVADKTTVTVEELPPGTHIHRGRRS